MYKLIIVDDEEIMRDGLMNLVNWESMGFQVVADFEDGQEALEYLKSNTEVDVLLTDIKMTFISGLDLARYINEQKLPTKVVLISGYKDFEYAREAVNCNVIKYLLKPISLKDIKKTFVEVKLEIDKERESKKREKEHQKKYNELISFMQDQFFADLVLGALSDPEEINKKLEMLDLDLDSKNSPCCLWSATINSYEEFISKNWEYGLESFYKAIANIFCRVKNDLKSYFIKGKEGRFKILFIGTPGIYKIDFMKKIKIYTEKAIDNAQKLLGIKLESHYEDFYENIYALASNTTKRFKLNIKSQTNNTINLNMDVKEHLLDQQKLLMTHVLNGNRESAFSLMDQILKEIISLGPEQARNFLTNLFDTLLNQLQKNGIYISQLIKKELIDFSTINLQDLESVKQSFLARLDNILQKVKDDGQQSDNTIINHIKEYIHKNYNKDITLEQIADHVFLSPVYISRLFKEKTGENFSDYLIKIKMEKALKLLRDPRHKVYEVGYQIGYKSTKYFYKVFKQYYGCTPTEYRKIFNTGRKR